MTEKKEVKEQKVEVREAQKDTEDKVEKEDQIKTEDLLFESKSHSPPIIKLQSVQKDFKTEAFCVRYSPNSTQLAAGFSDGHMRIFNAYSGKLMFDWFVGTKSYGTILPVTSIRFRPAEYSSKVRNVVLVAGADGTIQHWHTTSGKRINKITEKDNTVQCIDYRADGKVFASAGSDAKVRVYDEELKQLANTMEGGNAQNKTIGHTNRVFSLKFHPEHENVIITGGWDNTVQIWDIRQEEAVRRIYGPYLCGDCVDVHKDVVLTGSWREKDQLQEWDFKSGKLMKTYDWGIDEDDEQCKLYCAEFSHDGRLVAAGGSGRKELKIFDRITGKPLYCLDKLDRGIYSVDFALNGSGVSCCGGQGFIYTLSVYEF